MDFVNDDIESMTREYERWKRQLQQASGQMDEQRKVTEEHIQPLYDRLAEVEEQIRDKQLRINNTKAQILKNEMTIRGLLGAVVSVK